MSLPAHPEFQVWIPDYDSAMGGIQVFSRYFLRALAECLPGAQLTVFSKNDRSFSRPSPGAGRGACYCTGKWPPGIRTPAFSLLVLAKALQRRPDLILSTHVNFSPLASWLKYLAGIPYVAVAHGLDAWGARGHRLRKPLRHADRVLAVSEFTRSRLLREARLPPALVGLLPNTVDEDHYVPGPKPAYLLKRFGLRPDQPVILTVARLAGAGRGKGYDRILRALPGVRQAVPNVHYIIGGRGADRPRVEALIRELHLSETVILAGYVPDHELCDFYNLCDVFAMPSKGEGFGIVFLEALACGKPVLAGNQDGSVDALLNGELGVLVDPDDEPAIADALSAMLKRQHPLAILRQPQRLRERVLEAYGYRQFVSRVGGHLALLGFAPPPVAAAKLVEPSASGKAKAGSL